MRDNIFAEVYEDPFVTNEEWFPLLADNVNSAPGDDIPSLAAYRRVRVATMFFIVRRQVRATEHLIESPIADDGFDGAGRLSLAHLVKDWFLSDPA